MEGVVRLSGAHRNGQVGESEQVHRTRNPGEGRNRRRVFFSKTDMG